MTKPEPPRIRDDRTDRELIRDGDDVGSIGYVSYIEAIAQEYKAARERFKPMRGPHEGYAVILEELDEMWDAIKANNIPEARKECLQVAAMCLAFLLEVTN